MTSAPWTEADAAELDALTFAFVDGFYGHRERCVVCGAGGRWCVHAREALAVLLDWMRFRELRSRAEWHRLRRQAA